MAIDTAKKRRSSAAARRMPWMRRFGIAPDGTIDQGDRQQGSWVYQGILADAPASVTGSMDDWEFKDRTVTWTFENRVTSARRNVTRLKADLSRNDTTGSAEPPVTTFWLAKLS